MTPGSGELNYKVSVKPKFERHMGTTSRSLLGIGVSCFSERWEQKREVRRLDSGWEWDG
jgi:hypothetical protein